MNALMLGELAAFMSLVMLGSILVIGFQIMWRHLLGWWVTP